MEGCEGSIGHMYPMPEFRESDPKKVVEFVRQYPFAILTGVGKSGRVEATHVPLLLDELGAGLRLRGHVMRKTTHWHALGEASEVLAAFTGPDAPVLASWNQNREFGGTWNYMAAHLRGKLTYLDQAGTLEIIRELKDLFEEDPTAKFDSLPAEYIDRLIGAIQGFEIRVDSVEAVFKLSQNRNLVDFDNTLAELRTRGGESAMVAEEMAARRSQYHPPREDRQ